MLIYIAKNIINNKLYIGKTTKTLQKRIYQHVRSIDYGSVSVFHLAIKKYGIENFCFDTLIECQSDDKLNMFEKFYIDAYKSKSPNGYNLTDGGDGNSAGTPSAFKGRKHSEETKQKIKEKRKLQLCSDATRKKMSESQKSAYKEGRRKPICNGMPPKFTPFIEGHIPWNKGMKGFRRGCKPWNKGLTGIKTNNKGRRAWNKGLKKEDYLIVHRKEV